jgi:stearoyl-CoA desaturase (delta-9 desaturase)
LVVIHLVAIAAIFTFTWSALIVGVVLLCIVGGPGIGVGYHRLLTHRGFQTPKWVEYIFVTMGALALESGPIQWVATHRIHHANTDVPGDPHTPREGLWWSHLGWILRGKAQRHDEVTLQRYVPDLLKDKYYVWLSKYFYIPQVILGLLLLAGGGIPWLVWGLFLRTVIGLHVTWFVNSVTHVWGYRHFETRDDSTNNWLIGLLAFGEGWHNNHHAFPTSARHGLAWYEVDMNWWVIRGLKAIGLAHKVKLVNLRQELEKLETTPLRKAA